MSKDTPDWLNTRHTVILLAVAAATGGGCSSKNLSKDEAKKQILEDSKDWKPIYCTIGDVVEADINRYNGETAPRGFRLEHDADGACMNQLVQQRFAAPGRQQELDAGAALKSIWAVEPRARFEKVEGQSEEVTLHVVCSHLELDDVTSVTTEGKHSTVSYTTKLQPDPASNALTKCKVGAPTSTRTSWQRKFRQDDEGKWSFE